MRVSPEGQITIPPDVRSAMGIHPAETEVEFVQDEIGRWYLVKTQPREKNRFRTDHPAGAFRMTAEEIIALTRQE